MTRAAKIEAIGVATATIAAFFGRRFLPPRLTVGEIALAAAALLLLQGLARDLVRLRAERGPAQRVRCACVESLLGVGAIVAAGAMLLGGLDWPVSLGRAFWPAFVAAVGALGVATRDLVVDFDRRTIRREPRHGSVVLW